MDLGASRKPKRSAQHRIGGDANIYDMQLPKQGRTEREKEDNPAQEKLVNAHRTRIP